MNFILREFCFVKNQPKYSKRNPQIIVLNTCVVGGPGDIAVNQTDTILVPPWDFYSSRKKQKQNQIYMPSGTKCKKEKCVCSDTCFYVHTLHKHVKEASDNETEAEGK